MDRLPRPGDLYRHYTDKIYQVITVAVHAQTGEQMAVYQAMFGEFGVYAGSLEWFLGEIDREKYPQVAQRYLFEKIEKTGTGKTEIGKTGTGKTGTGKIGIEEAGISGAGIEGIKGTEINEAGIKEEEAGINEAGIAKKIRTADARSGKAALASDSGAKRGGFRPGVPVQAGYQQELSRKPAFQIAAMGQEFQTEPAGADLGQEIRPRIQSPAESRRALRQEAEKPGRDSYYQEKRRRQIEEREQRRGMFRKPQKHESATEELRANPCLLRFLDADTYEQKYQVLNDIQDDITDRLIDDIAVVLDVVIPEGPLNDRYHQLRNIILTRQKYETDRFR